MEDKFKNLEYGVKVLSSVAMQRKISPLDADDNQQNNVGSLLSANEGKKQINTVLRCVQIVKPFQSIVILPQLYFLRRKRTNYQR